MPTKTEVTDRLKFQLNLAAEIRDKLTAEPQALERRQSLRTWQSERLARTHADLLESPRFRDTALLFLSDIYGPRDLNQHLDAVRRLLPMMTNFLPVAGLETVADAIELNALSESLDADMAAILGNKAFDLNDKDYAQAYRRVGRRAERERQIELIVHLGQSLNTLTRRPFIGTTLFLMRTPAALAGLTGLQEFLERGYAAFRRMRGADEFLDKIASREQGLLETWFRAELPSEMRKGLKSP